MAQGGGLVVVLPPALEGVEVLQDGGGRGGCGLHGHDVHYIGPCAGCLAISAPCVGPLYSMTFARRPSSRFRTYFICPAACGNLPSRMNSALVIASRVLVPWRRVHWKMRNHSNP